MSFICVGESTNQDKRKHFVMCEQKMSMLEGQCKQNWNYIIGISYFDLEGIAIVQWWHVSHKWHAAILKSCY